MGDRQSVEDLQWLAYVGHTKDDIIHAGNGREIHLPCVPNVKVDRYSPKTRGLRLFGMFLAWVTLHAQSTQAHRHHSRNIAEQMRIQKRGWKN